MRSIDGEVELQQPFLILSGTGGAELSQHKADEGRERPAKAGTAQRKRIRSAGNCRDRQRRKDALCSGQGDTADINRLFLERFRQEREKN